MFKDWIIFLLLGRVLIYLWQRFPLPTWLEKHSTIEKLHNCDLCSGTWIYGILSYCVGVSLLRVLGFHYVPVISEVVTGGITSFVMWIFVAGWKEKFSEILVI